MPSVVLDASMLVGALLKPGSAPERALLLAYGRDRICMSEAVAEEVRSVFGRPKFAAAVEPARIGLILDLLMSAAHWFVPTQHVVDCRDTKDNKYLELALAAGVDYLVTSDSDLLILGPWRGTMIVRPLDFVTLSVPDA